MILARRELELLEPDHVITGMAQGWDMEVASACAELRIPFTAAVPFFGQADRWHHVARQRYADLLTFAENVKVLWGKWGPDVYRWRDEWMVDRADLVLSLLDPAQPKSGTGMTVAYAARKSVPTINVWKDWLALGPRAGLEALGDQPRRQPCPSHNRSSATAPRWPERPRRPRRTATATEAANPEPSGFRRRPRRCSLSGRGLADIPRPGG